jgi:hypothetical protein
MDLTYEMEVRDKDGNLISFQRKQSKSLLKTFGQALRAVMYSTMNASTESIKDTTNTSRNFPALSNIANSLFNVNSPATNANYGILVGTGATAVNRDQYALTTKIAHGNGSGQIMYKDSIVESCNGTPPATVWRVIRTFSNDFSTTITVNEIGLAIYHQSIPCYIMIARDLATQAVVAGATLTVRYIFTVTA